MFTQKMACYTCEVCNRFYNNRTELNKHVTKRHKHVSSHILSAFVPLENDALACRNVHCSRGFLSVRERLLHEVYHIKYEGQEEENCSTKIKKFECPKCDRKFVLETTLQAHAKVHQPYPHICHCTIGYYELEDLKAHKRLVHSEIGDKENWQSDNIMKSIESKTKTIKKPSKSKLKTSKKRNGNKKSIKNNKKKQKTKSKGKTTKKVPKKKKKPKNKILQKMIKMLYKTCLKCTLCEKVYTQKHNLQYHIAMVHTGERNFVCETCDKKFGCKGALQRHRKIHADQRQFKCKFCSKGFNDQSSVIRHHRIHTKEMKYPCQQCPMQFTDASGLWRHKMTHTGIRKHSCDKCPKKFFTRYDLREHVARMHNYE